ncbi:hypothetical protein I4U23_014970 [Adineta vaga]|nr:hypothetical protein I4U23_014970 [Adineta vaga]
MNMWNIELKLIDSNDKQLNHLKQYLKKSIMGLTSALDFARYMHLSGNWEQAEYFYKRSLETEKIPYRHAVIYNDLGLVQTELKDYKEAEKSYKESCKIKEACQDLENKDFASTYNNMGIAYYQARDLTRAEEHFKKALEAYTTESQENQELLAAIYHKRATIYSEKDDYENALECIEQCWKIRSQILPSIHSTLAITYNCVANIYYQKGSLKEAIRYAAKAVDIDKQAVSDNHPQIKIHKQNLEFFKLLILSLNQCLCQKGFPQQFQATMNISGLQIYDPSVQGVLYLLYDYTNLRARLDIQGWRAKQNETYMIKYKPEGAESGSPAANDYTIFNFNPDYPETTKNDCWYSTNPMKSVGPFPMAWYDKTGNQFEIKPWFPLPSNLINKGDEWVPELEINAVRYDSPEICNLKRTGIGNVPCLSYFETTDRPVKLIQARAAVGSYDSDSYTTTVFLSFVNGIPAKSEALFNLPNQWPSYCGNANAGFTIEPQRGFVVTPEGQDHLTLKLNSPPVRSLGDQVKVEFKLNPSWYYNGTKCATFNPITFTSDNWQIPQQVDMTFADYGCCSYVMTATSGGYEWQYQYSAFVVYGCEGEAGYGCKGKYPCGVNNFLYPRPNPAHYSATSHPNYLIWIPSNGSIPSIPCFYFHLSQTRPLIIWSHGNGCDIGTMAPLLQFLSQQLHVNILIYEYPGYGLCTNEIPSEETINQHTQQAYHFARNHLHYSPDRIVFYGHSIGSGTACMMVASLLQKGISVGGLILQSPYKSLTELVKQKAGVFSFFIRHIGWNNFNSMQIITCPVLFLHGKQDDLISYDNSVALYNVCPSHKKHIILIDNADHNTINLQVILQHLGRFLHAYLH